MLTLYFSRGAAVLLVACGTVAAIVLPYLIEQSSCPRCHPDAQHRHPNTYILPPSHGENRGSESPRERQ
jgi:hypothetical protein